MWNRPEFLSAAPPGAPFLPGASFRPTFLRAAFIRTALAALLAPALSASAFLPAAPAHAAAPSAACGDVTERPWCRASLPPDRRAALLLAALTLDEKADLMAGDEFLGQVTSGWDPNARAGTLNGVPRLGVPALRFSGGDAGVRQGTATALPAPIALAAAFDPAAARRHGALVGDETRRKGSEVTLGPALDLIRNPRFGRSFEQYGEDPHLTARLGVEWIRAAQAQGVMASAKHFAAYNQEADRYTVDAVVGDRALREIYLPPFEAAVREGGAATVMCAYNKVNGAWNCENRTLLGRVLREEWRFPGIVVSDWMTQLSGTAPAARAGLDLEMPIGQRFNPLSVRAEIAAGRLDQATLDSRVRAILRTMFAFGVFDRPPYPNAPETIDVPAHLAAARELAEEGVTLLKNDRGVLPLDRPASIAVIGSAADAYVSGGGSSQVLARSPVTPLQGIRERAARAGIRVDHDAGADRARAAALARRADVAVVVAADARTEFADQWCLALICGDALRGDQDALIEAVATANPETVVVLENGGPVLLPWAGRVAGIVQAWYPGEQGGNALARVLFGDVDPGGRSPVTFPAAERDAPASGGPAQYPGRDGSVHYSEGVLVGYRHYDARRITPRFAFGHGLSYTTFAFGGLAVHRDRVEVTVTNTGARRGTAVPQLYLGLPGTAEAPQPPRQLKGFAKVRLDPGQSRRVTMPLNDRAFSYWDETAGAWRAAPGCTSVMVGTSSRDIVATDRLC
ncbi:beta-glucosidase [Actinomadura rugatobispora]|uniref:Beta-glucosidase n=1 Tax=Actinomadura rugatobispora TaxID=1994 RepID=A0ABW1ACA8_9ACTN|nr:glycoside hydrolase family 3 C-terminal domain-containing protein [Actinomadura rugatobispora]